jgi:predicted nucleotidyltransferase
MCVRITSERINKMTNLENATLLFESVSGSRLYGTDTPESDLDTRGVFLPSVEDLLSPFPKAEVLDKFEEEDRTLYSLSKFFFLASENNPNILELLFVPNDKVLTNTSQWNHVVENRHLFLSKRIRDKFLGYAFGQIERLESHRRWFVNPPASKPLREEFGLKHTPDVSMVWLESLKNTMNFTILKEEYADMARREMAYRDEKRDWDNYRKWKETRNPARRGSEELYGYDTKFAMHVLRLMETGKQLLLTGEVEYPLTNSEFLLGVRNGSLTYEEFTGECENLRHNFNTWRDMSDLPNRVDYDALRNLYMEVLGDVVNG